MNQENNRASAPIQMTKTVSIPIALAESLQGRYFTAETPHLVLNAGTAAWGALFNPPRSGVNMHINVATLNYVYGGPLTLGFYMNSELPGEPFEADMPAPANTAFQPLPKPQVRLMYTSDADGEPVGGFFTFSRTAEPGQTVVLEKNGVFVVPPGGNYCGFVTSLEEDQEGSSVYLVYEWWEEPIK